MLDRETSLGSHEVISDHVLKKKANRIKKSKDRKKIKKYDGRNKKVKRQNSVAHQP